MEHFIPLTNEIQIAQSLDPSDSYVMSPLIIIGSLKWAV